MLFRPEEVVLTSSSATVDHGLFGPDMSHNAVVGFDVDTVGTVGAGVFQLDVIFPVLAVDQQQEIDRSRDAEFLVVFLFTWVQGNGVKRESQSIGKPAVIFRQGVLAGRPPVWEIQESQPSEHPDAITRFFAADAQSSAYFLSRWQSQAFALARQNMTGDQLLTVG